MSKRLFFIQEYENEPEGKEISLEYFDEQATAGRL